MSFCLANVRAYPGPAGVGGRVELRIPAVIGVNLLIFCKGELNSGNTFLDLYFLLLGLDSYARGKLVSIKQQVSPFAFVK